MTTPLNKPRCEHCGRSLPAWSKPEVIEALRAFAGRRGRPPRESDFRRAGVRYPAASTVKFRFGSWKAALDAAGLVRPDTHNKQTQWTRDTVIRAMWDWKRDHGAAPSADEWMSVDPAGKRPTTSVVRYRFGSWSRGVIAAGLEPRRARRRAPA